MCSKLVCSDYEKELLMQRLANDFKVAVKKYRKAKSEDKISRPIFSCEIDYKEERKRANTINTSEGYIGITRVEYWENILKSKIESINAVGGFKFMQDFYYFLRESDLKTGEEYLDSEGVFCCYANGIGEWIS